MLKSQGGNSKFERVACVSEIKYLKFRIKFYGNATSNAVPSTTNHDCEDEVIL